MVKQANEPGSNAAKDPDAWVTGDEPATGAQRSYLQTLAEATDPRTVRPLLAPRYSAKTTPARITVEAVRSSSAMPPSS